MLGFHERAGQAAKVPEINRDIDKLHGEIFLRADSVLQSAIQGKVPLEDKINYFLFKQYVVIGETENTSLVLYGDINSFTNKLTEVYVSIKEKAGDYFEEYILSSKGTRFFGNTSTDPTKKFDGSLPPLKLTPEEKLSRLKLVSEVLQEVFPQ